MIALVWLATAATVGAAVLWVRPPVRLPRRHLEPGAFAAAPGRLARLAPWAAAPVVFVALHGLWIGVGLVLAGAGLGVGWLARRSRARKRADALRRTVVEACEAVASELRAGRTPAQALARGAELWRGLVPVAAAAELDADVPAAFYRVATTRGAEALLELGAYWHLSAQTGAGLAEAADRAADHARAHLATQRLVARELAGAQATARTVVALPVVITALSQGSGSDPVGFLTTTLPGLGCLALGLAFGLAGLGWIEAIVSAVERECTR